MMAAPRKKTDRTAGQPRRGSLRDRRARRKRERTRARESGLDSAGQRRRKAAGRMALVAAAAFVCILPPLLAASPITYLPLLAVVLMLLVSWVYLRVLVGHFSFDENQMTRSCERGRDVGMRVALSNGSFLPFPRVEVAFYITDLFGEYDAMRTMTVTLAPHEKAVYDFGAGFTHLGRYSAGVDHIVIYDLLGIFSTRLENATRRTVIVRPRLFDFHEPDISEASEDESVNLLKPLAADSTDYASVREYQYGDPLKTVHWNLSARSADGTMYTRLFEVYVSPSVSVVVDSFSDCDDAEDLMGLFDGIVESSASFSRYARSQGVECVIRYLDRSCEPASACLASEDDADELVLDLRRIGNASRDEALADIPIELLRSEGTGSLGASNVAFATSRLNDEVVTALIDVAAHRRNAILLLTLPRTLPARERTEFLKPLRRLSDAQVSYFVLESNEVETKVAQL